MNQTRAGSARADRSARRLSNAFAADGVHVRHVTPQTFESHSGIQDPPYAYYEDSFPVADLRYDAVARRWSWRRDPSSAPVLVEQADALFERGLDGARARARHPRPKPLTRPPPVSGLAGL